MTFVVIGVRLILWGIACVVFRDQFDEGAEELNDASSNGFLQPPDVLGHALRLPAPLGRSAAGRRPSEALPDEERDPEADQG